VRVVRLTQVRQVGHDVTHERHERAGRGAPVGAPRTSQGEVQPSVGLLRAHEVHRFLQELRPSSQQALRVMPRLPGPPRRELRVHGRRSDEGDALVSVSADGLVPGEIPEWTLGWRLQRALAHAGIGAQEMADELGVTRSTVSRWMNDRGGPPRLIYVRQWALLTGVPASWVLGIDESSPRGEVDTKGDTRRYHTGNRRSRGHLSLVSSLPRTNCGVSGGYGSSLGETRTPEAVALLDSSGLVNDAHTA
jgi:transcriptional regulator with XRE-family HTH domain